GRPVLPPATVRPQSGPRGPCPWPVAPLCSTEGLFATALRCPSSFRSSQPTMAPSDALTTAPLSSVPLPEPRPPGPLDGPPPRRLGWGWVLLTGTFAFLLASFPARNSDLYQHLATGKLLAGGEDPSGATDLLPALQGRRTWLYDLVCYGLHEAVGGS